MTRFYVPLTQEEFLALVKRAQKNLRHPRDEARWIIRCVLSGVHPDDEETCTTVGLSRNQAGERINE